MAHDSDLKENPLAESPGETELMNPVEIPIEDVLDLHHFRPQEISALLDDYLNECLKAGIFSVRIIHGKGQGILKNQVRRKLENNPIVASFQDAPIEAGGWGATIVELKNIKY